MYALIFHRKFAYAINLPKRLAIASTYSRGSSVLRKNGGDDYGTFFFSRFNVFRKAHHSVADVHRFDKQKVAYKVEKPPKLWRDGRIFCLKFSATHLVGGCLSIYIITLFRHFSRNFPHKSNAPAQREYDYHNHYSLSPRRFCIPK